MEEKKMLLSEYLGKIPVKDRSNFLFNMAVSFSQQTVNFLSQHDKKEFNDIPSGIEGCIEYLERNANSCQVTFYTENGEIVGCELKFKREFPDLH